MDEKMKIKNSPLWWPLLILIGAISFALGHYLGIYAQLAFIPFVVGFAWWWGGRY